LIHAKAALDKSPEDERLKNNLKLIQDKWEAKIDV
jgi:hypothetical protein